MSSSPSTVTEAVSLLTDQGYTADLGSRGSETHGTVDHSHNPAELIIEKVFRFEGDSDPADEAIVVGVFCSDCDARGIVVSAYGHGADPVLMERLRHIA